jgi:hypothetical protein
MKPYILIAALAIMLAAQSGCRPHTVPVVDTSTDDAYTQSLIVMRDSLPADERIALADSLLILGLASRQPNEQETDADKRFYQRVNGKTAHEIIAAAKALQSLPRAQYEKVTHRFKLAAMDRDNLESPEIAVDDLGRIYLVWASWTDIGQKTMYLAVSTDAGASFSEPRAISQSAVFEIATSEGIAAVPIQPHVGAAGDRVVLGWTQSVAENKTVCLVAIESTDGAITFSKPVCVHQSLESRPIFTSMAVAENAVVFCWLDNRAKLRPYVAVRHDGDFTESPLGAGTEETFSSPTAVLLGKAGEIFISAGLGKRDSRTLLMQRDGESRVLAEYPDSIGDSSSLIVSGDKLVVVSKGPFGVISRDVTVDVKLDLPSEIGCRATVDSEGGIHATWVEEDTEQSARRAVMYSKSDGGTFAPPISMNESQEYSQSQPAIAAAHGNAYFAWNEYGSDESHVVFTRLREAVESP